MRFLITGASGQLGYDIEKKLIELGVEYYAPNSEEMDITDEKKVSKVIDSYKPNIIFHCAAYTAVDKAEEAQEKCYNVNVNGTKNITAASLRNNTKVVYISTDYVFDGTKEGIYLPEDETKPINYYGYTKLLGEKIVSELKEYLIVRISWVFGENGNNFVKTMLRLADTKDEISVVCDQIGSPTYTEDLAALLIDMVYKNKNGIYHITNEGYCSWYEFAKYIFEINNKDIKVNPILSKDYKVIAKRPLNSKLSKEKLDDEQLNRLPNWKDATYKFCQKMRKED